MVLYRNMRLLSKTYALKFEGNFDYLKLLQESLANAKISRARQRRVYEGPSLGKKSTANQRKEHNAEKYIQ